MYAPNLGEEIIRGLGTIDADKFFIIYDNTGHFPMDSKTAEFMGVLIFFIEKYC